MEERLSRLPAEITVSVVITVKAFNGGFPYRTAAFVTAYPVVGSVTVCYERGVVMLTTDISCKCEGPHTVAVGLGAYVDPNDATGTYFYGCVAGGIIRPHALGIIAFSVIVVVFTPNVRVAIIGHGNGDTAGFGNGKEA